MIESELKFPEWQAPLQDVLLEFDSAKLEQQIHKVEALITRANSVPLANHLGDGQVADGAMLLYGVADALYSRSSWPARTPSTTGTTTRAVTFVNAAAPRHAPRSTNRTCEALGWERTLRHK